MTTILPDVSLVLACYNEEPILERSVGEIFRVLDALRYTSEVIFVDDVSCDRTSGIIDDIMIANPERELRKIKHSKNAGRGGTVSDGIRTARGRFVGFIDIDLEVHARYMLPCLLALEQGYDVATAFRVYKFHLGSLHRYVLSHGYRSLLRWKIDVPLKDTETGYKFFRLERILPVLDQVQDQGWFWDTEIMVRAHLAGLRIIEIPALHERSTDRPSSVKVFHDSLMYFKKLHQFSRSISQLKDRSRQ